MEQNYSPNFEISDSIPKSSPHVNNLDSVIIYFNQSFDNLENALKNATINGEKGSISTKQLEDSLG